MAYKVAFRGLIPAGSPVCRRCLGRSAAQTTSVSQQRGLKTRYGPKYQAKVDAAAEEWKGRAARIEGGEAECLWDIFEQRGYVKDTAGQRDDIRNLMTQKRIGAYVGIDPTAPSLHVGHLLPLMPLFWMYMHGYRAITLVGGATAKIGDPTDRLVSRDDMGNSAVAMNMVKIHYQLKKIWTNVESQARRYGYEKDWAWRRAVLQNGHWWNKLPMLELLQRLGKGIRIGPMLSRETVRRKLKDGDGMSFAEFTYPLMQAWDWWHMYQSLGVQMQIGGSDQYGNIITGVDSFKVIRDSEPDLQRKLPTGPMHDPVGFTVPLLTDSSGAKFGKSAGNAVWLDAFKTTSFDLYGYFVRRPDADAENLLKLFTFIPLPEIQKIMEEHSSDPARRAAQHALAYEVVTLVHGADVAKETQEQHRVMYQKGSAVPVSTEPSAAAVHALSLEKEGVPITPNNAPPVDLRLPQSLINEGKVARILYAAGLVSSVSEGNRLAAQKGAYVGAAPGQPAALNKGMLLTQVNFTPVALWFPQDTKNFIVGGKYLILRKGQHNLRIIEVVSDDEWKASGLHYPGEPGTGIVRRLKAKLEALKETDKDGNGAAGGTAIGQDKKSEASLGSFLDEPESGSSELVFPDQKKARVRDLEDKIQQAYELRVMKTDFPELTTEELRDRMYGNRKEQSRPKRR